MVIVVKIKSRREICALFATVFRQSKRDRGKKMQNFEIRFQSSFCLDTPIKFDRDRRHEPKNQSDVGFFE